MVMNHFKIQLKLNKYPPIYTYIYQVASSVYFFWLLFYIRRTNNNMLPYPAGGPGSSVGIATGYGLDVSETFLSVIRIQQDIINELFMWSTHYYCQIWMKLENFQQIFKNKKSHFNIHENPSSGSQVVPYEWCGQGVLLNTHPLLVPRSWKSRAIPLPTLWATTGL